MDLYNREKKIENLKQRFRGECANCFSITDGFERQLKLNNYSIGRIDKYWSFLRSIHTLNQACFGEFRKEQIEELVIKIDSNNKWSEWTKVDFKKVFKFFYRWIKSKKLEGDYPEEVKWIRTRMKRNNEKTPEHYMTKDEIELVSTKAENLMERAFILSLYETGCRISEFLNIRIKDIQFDQYGCVILVSGKTGWRRVRVLDYSKDLIKWLDSHPLKSDSESFVWIDPKNQKRVYPDDANHLLKKLAIKFGTTKKANPHAFRHSRATHLAKILTEQQLKVYFGWANDSRMASVYVHLSGKDVDEALLKAKGIKTDIKEESRATTKKCQRCEETNSILSNFCKKCYFPLDAKAYFETEKFEDCLIEFFKIIGNKFPDLKKDFVGIVKERKLEHLFEGDKDETKS